MTADQRTAITYRLEYRRAAFSGIFETAGSTFLLLIAVSWFHAGANAKGLVAAGGSLGLMAAPLVLSAVEALRWPAARGASALVGFAGFWMLVMAAAPDAVVYVAGATITGACVAAAVPLITQIYQDNFPAEFRGRIFSRVFMVHIAVAAVFSHLAGQFLARDLAGWRGLLLVFAGALAGSSLCLRRMPSEPLPISKSRHPLRALRHVRDDALFRRILISWMVMGFGNLVASPLRIEYLANPAHGLILQADTIALVTGVVPNLARLALAPVWGKVFDRVSFFSMRAALNFGLALSIVAFFTSTTLPGLMASAIVYGISLAGGDVAWNLWVTKIAPSERVADYMSVHTLFTGMRGVAAPLLAFHAIAHLSLPAIGWLCAGLILLANALLVPEILAARRELLAPSPAAAAVDETPR